MYAAMQIPAGALADTLGARRTVTAGAALAGAGSLLFGLAPGIELSYLGRFLVGLGVSVTFVATLKFQANWFRAAEFGTVSGMLIVVGSLGAVVATTPVALAAQWLGWRGVFVAIGIVTGALAIAAWTWVRDRPDEAGTPPGWKSPIARGNRPDGSQVDREVSFRAGMGIVWRNRQTWAGLLAHFGLFGSYLALNGLWGVPYLMHVYGFDRVEASSYLLVASVGLLVSAPLAGHLSDRVLRRRRLPTVAMACLACTV